MQFKKPKKTQSSPRFTLVINKGENTYLEQFFRWKDFFRVPYLCFERDKCVNLTFVCHHLSFFAGPEPPPVDHQETDGLLHPYNQSIYTPYNKITGCLSVCVFVCLCVSKDLADHWTDIVIFYRVDSHRSWEGSWLFRGRVPPDVPLQNSRSIAASILIND